MTLRGFMKTSASEAEAVMMGSCKDVQSLDTELREGKTSVHIVEWQLMVIHRM